MIEFTFTHTSIGPWTHVVRLTPGTTGGAAFDLAASEYKTQVFPEYRPGHPEVTVAITGK